MEELPSYENMEAEIERLLDNLREYGEWFNELSGELQEEWNFVEMEADAGMNREAAKKKLELLIQKVDREVVAIKEASQF